MVKDSIAGQAILVHLGGGIGNGPYGFHKRHPMLITDAQLVPNPYYFLKLVVPGFWS